MSDEDRLGSEERRRGKRIKGDIVEYSIVGKEEKYDTAFLKDISVEGVCIFTPAQIPVNEKVFLKIFLSGKQDSVNVSGTVIWNQKAGYLDYHHCGVEYVDMDETNKSKVSSYIALFEEK